MTQVRSVAVITGAAGSIGSALVEAFEAASWQVVSTDLRPLPRAGHVVGDIADLADVNNAAGQSMLSAVRAAGGGRIKAVINNAAYQVVKPSSQLTAADWAETLRVNLLAPFWLTMALRDELVRNGGSMLAISSIHERLTKPGFVAYATSKAALSGMVRAMAVELGADLRCNALCPAAIATPMLQAGFEGREAAYRQLEEHHPSGRVGMPAEVAATALFMCSDAARFMNGACVDLSGGISARLHDPV